MNIGGKLYTGEAGQREASDLGNLTYTKKMETESYMLNNINTLESGEYDPRDYRENKERLIAEKKATPEQATEMAKSAGAIMRDALASGEINTGRGLVDALAKCAKSVGVQVADLVNGLVSPGQQQQMGRA